jgi:hypothetical protein
MNFIAGASKDPLSLLGTTQAGHCAGFFSFRATVDELEADGRRYHRPSMSQPAGGSEACPKRFFIIAHPIWRIGGGIIMLRPTPTWSKGSGE